MNPVKILRWKLVALKKRLGIMVSRSSWQEMRDTACCWCGGSVGWHDGMDGLSMGQAWRCHGCGSGMEEDIYGQYLCDGSRVYVHTREGAVRVPSGALFIPPGREEVG